MKSFRACLKNSGAGFQPAKLRHEIRDKLMIAAPTDRQDACSTTFFKHALSSMVRLTGWTLCAAFLSACGICFAQSATNALSPITIVICGDSTVANYNTNTATRRGWGQMIGAGFAPQVRVVNEAKNGRSTKTFIKEGLLKKSVEVKADYALIQFGHNDSHAKGRPEATDAGTDFKEYLRQFVDELRAAGTQPILVTPMHRRHFNPDGNPTEELLPYTNAMKEVAAEKNVPLVDLHASSGALLKRLGENGSEYLYHPGDRTHFDEQGARTMASLVLQGLEKNVPELKPYILHDDLAGGAGESASGKVAPKPLYRDPVYDGAADPTLIWNPLTRQWLMFYTDRRANVAGLQGVTWVHGTPIGMAASADGGATWKYAGDADIQVPVEVGSTNPTFWAPDVVAGENGVWHMFVTVVPGIFKDWNHPRRIVHLTSKDLKTWRNADPLELATDRAIDPCLLQMPDGNWRLWYNNETDHKSIYLAESRDLVHWTDRGKVIGDKSGEGPKVFRWQNHYWMIVDQWRGLGVYRSEDADQWTPQKENLLATPGTGQDDQVKGGHPDVVVSGGRAYLFYFTHPGRRGPDANKDTYEQRRSSIQVVELNYQDGWLTCDRDRPTHINLLPQP